MTKTYTLPMTCKEVHILIFVLCVAATGYGINMTSWNGDVTDTDVLGIGLTVSGMTGIIVYAIVALVVYENKIPRLKCRCEND